MNKELEIIQSNGQVFKIEVEDKEYLVDDIIINEDLEKTMDLEEIKEELLNKTMELDLSNE
ncbi:MAG: hypothetical protein ACK5HP_02530 [Bacilli bacterium]